MYWIIIMGKPPALLGDSQSLTFAGIYESLRTVNRSKFTVEEAFDGRFTEFKPLSVGLQVPCCVDSKMSEKSAIWRTPEILGTGAQRVSHTKGESGGGRSPDGRSCSHVDLDSTKIRCGSSGWFSSLFVNQYYPELSLFCLPYKNHSAFKPFKYLLRCKSE